MSKLQSEIARFLAWYRNLGEEAKGVVADQIRDEFRGKKLKETKKGAKKAVIIPSDAQIKNL